MSRETYLRWAANCHKLAAEAETDELRSAWLRVAANWREMAVETNGTPDALSTSLTETAGPARSLAIGSAVRSAD
jgi:hypothetical protein